MNSHDVLKKFFGASEFRPGQKECIDNFLLGKDVLAILHTGAGKSAAFQIPAILRPGLTIIISPLIALMKDQVDNATKRGICAVALNSSLNLQDRVKISTQIYSGICKLLYISPERLSLPMFQKLLKSIPLSAIVVDEAHCIAQDGPEFRPEYLRIGTVIKELHVPIFACTATATRETEKIIVDALGMKNPVIIRGSFNRANLYYEVRSKEIDEIKQIYALVSSLEGSGIVYRSLRSSTDETALKLRRMSLNSMSYHAGMLPVDRSRVQEDFLSGKTKIIVATIAFGIGLDKPDVRWVIHADIPKNIESYYQETGRAGRDGKPASCYLLSSVRDIPMTRKFIDRSLNVENRKKTYAQFLDMISYVQTNKCRRQQLLKYFGEAAPDYCGNCDVCERN
jgi:ATP-dependent DNA helicase RecQ